MSSPPVRNRPWLRVGAGVLALGALVSCEVGKLFQDGGSDPAAARLEFAAPSNGTAGEPLSPAVRVSAVDSAGTVDTTFHGAVTVTLGDNPGRGTLRGTRTVDAVRGVASFADLSINRAGTGYTLVATTTGVRGATSPAFDVAPAAAARLAFTAQPHTATVDSVLKPPVQVTALDTLGNVATSFAADVTVALAANASGGALGGTPTARATSGVATFADLSVNRAGKGYRLTASSGQLAGATSDSFDITAAPPTTGDLTVNATTTGDNQPGSYTVKVDGALSRTIAANGAGTTYSGLPAGDHTVALTDVPANCTVSGGASQTVTVPAGGAATAAFTISCAALTGSLTVTTSTTGPSAPSGYTVTVDRSQSKSIGPSDNVTYTGLATGNHAVQLNGVPSNCTVSEANPQTVTVPPSGSVTAAFTITCTQLTGSVTITTSTSGGTPDSNGYTVTVNGGGSKAIGTNDSVTFPGLATGNHTVTLSGIQSNCSVSGGTSRPVTVITGQTVSVPFTIDCPTVPPPNQPPTAAFTPHCTNLQCSFSDQSSDPDGSVVSWSWSFGDGQTATQQNPSHTYAAAGSYTVTLTVKDNQNASSSPASQTVNVTAPPPPATHLVFTVQPPSTVLLGASFQAQVAALDDQGNVVPTFTGSVSIRIASGVGGSLSGTTQVNAVGGYATFSDLHINSLIGTYTLGVSGGGLTGATSNSILVVAGIGLP